MKKVLYSLALLSLFVALMLLISCPGVKEELAPIVVPPTIQLTSPDNGEIFNGPQKVTLEWKHDYELGGIEYYIVYLDIANSFPNGMLGISATKSYDTNKLKEDVYYWKVVLYDDDRGGEQYESETKSFTIQSLDNTLQLISPADGEIFIGPQEITLEWEHEYELGTKDAYFVYLDTVNTFPNEELTLIQTESYVTDILKEDIYY